MFVSANFLAINYGVDDTIAKFFADRDPPANNLYWKDKLMYLRPEPGWLFIPLIVDLFYKCGIPRAELLSEKFISLMEYIGHISAQEEAALLSQEDGLHHIIAYVEDKTENRDFLAHIVDFMKGGDQNPFVALASDYKALHRGDLFLFSLVTLPFTEAQSVKLVRCWFALITTLLLLDDAEDIAIDQVSGDKNSFIESGLTTEGIAKLTDLIRNNLGFIATLNKSMATSLDKKFLNLAKKPFISELLNQ